jgi:hypothetical protein
VSPASPGDDGLPRAGSSAPLSWSERFAIRSPRLAVLRLEYVLAWVVVGGALAWLGAPIACGTLPDLGDPLVYMQGWIAVATGAAIAWSFEQWRRRPSLPRQEPLGVWLSPGVATLVVGLLYSVVLIAGAAADRHFRNIERDSLGEDARQFIRDARYGDDPAIARVLLQQPEGAGAEDETLSTIRTVVGKYVPTSTVQAARSCAAEASMGPDCGKHNQQGCSPETLNALARCSISHRFRMEISGNVARLSHARTGEYNRSFSEDLSVLRTILVLTATIGLFSGCAGVFPFRFAGLAAASVGAAELTCQELFEMVGTSGTEATTRLEHVAALMWGVYIALSAVVLAAHLFRKERDKWRDAGVLLLFLWPTLASILYYVPALRGGIGCVTGQAVCKYNQYKEVMRSWQHFLLLFGATACLYLTPLLSRYRRRPWST